MSTREVQLRLPSHMGGWDHIHLVKSTRRKYGQLQRPLQSAFMNSKMIRLRFSRKNPNPLRTSFHALIPLADETLRDVPASHCVFAWCHGA